MVVLAVVGGRYYNERAKVFKAITDLRTKYPTITTIVSGGATGADALAKRYAQAYNLAYIEKPAKWNDMTPPCLKRYRDDGSSYNALAGPKRNTEIVELCDGLIAFPGDRGTEDVIKKAKAAGKLLNK